ncbi:MAG: hypothetical protein ACKVP0_24460 [Pirellulaceae bacterium]
MRTPLLAAAVLGLLLPAMSLADIPVPGQPFRPRGPIERPPTEDNSIPQPVVVKREALKHADIKDARVIKAKIIIPRSMLPAEQKASIDQQTSGGSSTSTIFAGIALSLAAVSCVFLLRKNKVGKAAAIGVLVIAGGIGIWSAARADLIPGRRPRPPVPPPAAPVENTILMEIVEEGDSITLVLPK